MPLAQADPDEGGEGAIQDGDERSSAAALRDARRAGPSREERGGQRPDRAPAEGEKEPHEATSHKSKSIKINFVIIKKRK